MVNKFAFSLALGIAHSSQGLSIAAFFAIIQAIGNWTKLACGMQSVMWNNSVTQYTGLALVLVVPDVSATFVDTGGLWP